MNSYFHEPRKNEIYFLSQKVQIYLIWYDRSNAIKMTFINRQNNSHYNHYSFTQLIFTWKTVNKNKCFECYYNELYHCILVEELHVKL